MRQVLARRRSAAEPGPGPAPETGPAGPAAQRARRRWLTVAAWAAAAAAVFACYLRVSQTYPGDSYGAVFTLRPGTCCTATCCCTAGGCPTCLLEQDAEAKQMQNMAMADPFEKCR